MVTMAVSKSLRTCGIHLVTTTYLTWLPGDDRGHWSPLFDLYGRLRERGHRLREGDRDTRQHAIELAKDPPKILSPGERQIVAGTIGFAVTHPYSPPLVAGVSSRPVTFRPPRVLAAAIEATHFHLLVGVMREDVSLFIGRIKGTASSALSSLSENSGRQHIWTAGYWAMFLFDEGAVDEVQLYIEKHNLRRGLPAAPYAWVHPRPCPPWRK